MKFDHEKLEVCEILIQSWKTHHRPEPHNQPPASARSPAPARKMNRVTMVKSATGIPLFGFEYGGTGERTVQNTYSGGLVSSTRAFLYDREDVIAEFSNDTFATVFRRYIHGPGIDEPLAIMGDDVGEYTQYLHDGLGSVTGVVDENGKLGAIDYSAFGETRSNTVKIENRYRYTSREFVETNLYYYRARHMRPDLGRFISMDPLKMIDGTNMFGYVGNQPPEHDDPYGLFGLIGDFHMDYPPGTPYPTPTPKPPKPPKPPWNGNVFPWFSDQDMVCSVPWLLGQSWNSNDCILECCREHDKCYEKWNCNASSWVFTFTEYSYTPCSQCNHSVLYCIAKKMINPCCWY